LYYFICFRSGISQIVFQDLSNSNAPALLQGLFLLPKSYVFYESVVIREGSFMVFTLKDLTADTYTEVTVVQKEDGTIVSNEERMLNNQHEYLICDDDSPWDFPWGYSCIWDIIRTINHAELPYPMESDELEEYLRWDMISEEIQINGNWELVKVNNRWFAVSIEV